MYSWFDFKLASQISVGFAVVFFIAYFVMIMFGVGDPAWQEKAINGVFNCAIQFVAFRLLGD